MENKKHSKASTEAKHEVSHAKKSKTGFVWPLVCIILVALLVASIITSGFSSLGGSSSISGTVKEMSKSDVESKTQKYVSDLLTAQGSPQLVTVTVENETDGLYLLNIDVGGQKIPSYASKDGIMLFPSGLNMNQKIPAQSASTQAQAQSVPTSDKPTVDMYVMGFCPYGNQAEITMYPVYQLLKNSIDFNIHYIVSVSGNDVQSLHGQTEVTEDEREACVNKYYGKDAQWAFLIYVDNNCGSSGGTGGSCWQAAAAAANIDPTKISNCVTNEGVALMNIEQNASESAGANGSPTLVINGVTSNSVYSYGQTSVYQNAICAAFNNPPAACGAALNSTSSASASAGGSCGTPSS